MPLKPEQHAPPNESGHQAAFQNGNIFLRPIGWVENPFTSPAAPEQIQQAESRLVIEPELTPGLTGLEPGQEIVVIFYFHLARGYDLLQHPRGDISRPKRGVFALRSPRRPNPIGVSTVKLIAIEGNVLRVHGLDALDGSPVLDIKPAW